VISSQKVKTNREVNMHLVQYKIAYTCDIVGERNANQFKRTRFKKYTLEFTSRVTRLI